MSHRLCCMLLLKTICVVFNSFKTGNPFTGIYNVDGLQMSQDALAGTCHHNDITLTLIGCNDVTSTSVQHHFDVMCLPGWLLNRVYTVCLQKFLRNTIKMKTFTKKP